MYYIADFAKATTANKPSKKKTNYYQDYAGDTAKGAGAGATIGGLLGGMVGYNSVKPIKKRVGFLGLKKAEDKEATRKARIKAAKRGAITGAALGGYAGTGLGAFVGDTRNTLGNIKKKAKSPRDDKRRRYARVSQVVAGSGIPGAVIADATTPPGKKA